MIKKFNEFINENDSTYINWEEIEEICMNTPDLPDCVPANIRQWDVFIRQYERAVDLINGIWEPHYDWEGMAEFAIAINEQFYLGNSYKNSIYECQQDLMGSQEKLFKNVDWSMIYNVQRFTKWHIQLNSQQIHKLPLLPRKIGGSFDVGNNGLTSLIGAPNHVGESFICHNNKLTSLEGAPNYVGEDFKCFNNELTSLIGAPNHVGDDFNCRVNFLTSLEGAPNHVGGDFYCSNNNLPDSIPTLIYGKDLHKYIN